MRKNYLVLVCDLFYSEWLRYTRVGLDGRTFWCWKQPLLPATTAVSVNADQRSARTRTSQKRDNAVCRGGVEHDNNKNHRTQFVFF